MQQERQKLYPFGDGTWSCAFDYFEAKFSERPDPGERAYLKRLPTSFNLPDEAVDRLIEVGGLILRNNRTFRELLKTREI